MNIRLAMNKGKKSAAKRF